MNQCLSLEKTSNMLLGLDCMFLYMYSYLFIFISEYTTASYPFLKGIWLLVSLIPGVAVGLLVAALIAWKFGSDIR